MNQPFYTLKINSQYCGYTIAINGCLIENHEETSPLNMEYPVNQWLKTGDNTIEIYFYNMDDPEINKAILSPKAEITCELLVKQTNTENQKINVSTLRFIGKQVPRIEDGYKIDYNKLSPDLTCSASTKSGHYKLTDSKLISDNSGNIVVGEITTEKGPTKSVRVIQPINIPLPFPTWQFFSAEQHKLHYDLSDDEWEAFRVELLAEYQKIYDAINSRDLNKLKPLVEDRSREYGQAFYKDDGTELNELIERINFIQSDPEWELVPPTLSRLDISVAFNHQLVWMHAWDRPMFGGIGFSHNKSDLAKAFLFIFAKIDGKWKIVR